MSNKKVLVGIRSLCIIPLRLGMIYIRGLICGTYLMSRPKGCRLKLTALTYLLQKRPTRKPKRKGNVMCMLCVDYNKMTIREIASAAWEINRDDFDEFMDTLQDNDPTIYGLVIDTMAADSAVDRRK